MSSIFKLSIRGVRSFDPDSTETIQFGFPLTLICGQNGSGKTTIIECLKYATTGDLPPNSKGGAFVHDPKITGEREVRAQVKLAFSNANRVSMISTRTMQLLMKKTNSTFKTLEGQLAVMNKGERTTISTKCAELDTQIPLYLGVSKAILEYVIFCHQEDSLWPLSEPSVLKKRFDEIFEAMKFTKVLDDLKVIRKNIGLDMKILQQSVNHLKIDKERAGKTRSRIESICKDIETYKKEVEVLNSELDRVSAATDKLFKTNQEFQEVLTKAESLRNTKRSLEGQSKRLQSFITMLEDSDEELSNKFTNFDSLLAEKAKDAKIFEEKLVILNETLATTRIEYNAAIRKDGQLKAREEKYKQDLDDRVNLVRLNQGQFDKEYSMIDEDSIREFGEIVESKLKSNEKKKEELARKNREREKELNNSLSIINDSKTREEQHKKYQIKDLQKFEKDINLIKSKIDSLQFNEGNIEYEKSQLENMVKKFSDLKDSKEIENIAKVISNKNEILSKMETEIESLNKQVNLSNKQSDVHAKISLLKEDKQHRNKAIHSMINSITQVFEDWLGEKFDVSTCEQMLSAKILEAQEIIEIDESNNKHVSQELSNAEINAKYDEDKILAMKAETKVCMDRIESILPDDIELDEYETFILNLEEDYQIAMENMKLQNMTRDFNLKALEIAEREKVCILCRRGFETDNINSFLSLLKRQTEKISEQELQDEYKKLKSDLEIARSISTDISNVRKFRMTLKALEEEKSSKVHELQLLSDNLSTSSKKLELSSDNLKALESLRKPVSEIHRMKREIDSIETQINTLSDELNEFGVSHLSMSELQELQEKKNKEIKELRKSLSQSSELKELKLREYSRLENSIKDKKLSVSDLEKSSIEKENYLKMIGENTEYIKNLKSDIAQVDTILNDLTNKYSDMKMKFENMIQENAENEKKLEGETLYIKNLYTELNVLEQSIQDFLCNVSKELQRNKLEIATFEDKMKSSETNITSLAEMIKNIETSINESNTVQHNIRHNLEYRQLQREESEIEHQILELDIQNAETQREKYQEEAKKLGHKYSDLTVKNAGKVGEIKQMEDQIKSLESELGTDYKDIEKVYHREWVKLQTNMLVSNDLATYSKALDNAIMKYHSMKMEEINRIIDELWKKTYSGTDVDAILIRSDVNIQTKGNRSYNYRVVMVKQGVELDMRGRCSAGQKVLASIIIRLALAECFGINCGMIALDEPTTNLDIENIESLARSLNNIIDMRKSQKNFQLIVITHDEKFLNHINGDQFTDHFYKVERNERQKSTIKSLPISLINEV